MNTVTQRQITSQPTLYYSSGQSQFQAFLVDGLPRPTRT